MQALTVLYDGRCGLCRDIKRWLEREPAYVPLVLLPAGSAEALARFPGVAAGELAVISDTGQVWLGDRAFLLCLWALKEYRSWAMRLATPALLPLARQAFAALSSGRFAISVLLGLRGEAEIQQALRAVPLPACEVQP
jgi:predicted DCC family thiol-disulfide oxidoreductase YuxK